MIKDAGFASASEMLYVTPATRSKQGTMTKAILVLAALLLGISAAQAAPIKAKYCSAVGVHATQENQLLTDSLGKFARGHALKKLSNQGPNTTAWRNDDSTLQLAVTANVVEQGSIVTLFDTNQPTGPTSAQLAFVGAIPAA